MKIVIDARTLTNHFPGIGRYVSNLLMALGTLPDRSLFHVLKGPDISDYPIPSCFQTTITHESVFSLRQHWTIPKLIQNIGGSLYHSTYYLMPYMVKAPVVFTCYDLIPIVYPAYFSPVQRTIYRIAHLFAAKASSHVIAISESTKSDLMRHCSIDEKKITAIPLAADTRYSPQTRSSIDEVRGIYGLPQPYCLYIGTNKPHKNLLGLLKAWKLLHDQNGLEGNCLVIAGRWDARYPEAKEYTQSAGLSKSVVFIGDVDEKHMPAIYSGANLFVHPSFYEGFGLPIVEAMACGTAVACSLSSSLPEVAGDAAVFFNPKDPESIASILGNILADMGSIDSLKEKSIHQASQFSWEKTAFQTNEVYRTIWNASSI